MESPSNILVYVLRQDLRVKDNPIFHHLATSEDHSFTHVLPVYVFLSQQTELSGFVQDGDTNPYPEARSQLGGYWRCGPHRARFIGQAVWDLKKSLEALGSGLCIRVGALEDALRGLIEGLVQNGQYVGAVWMTSHVGTEEERDEEAAASVCKETGAQFKLWVDEKYLIDE